MRAKYWMAALALVSIFCGSAPARAGEKPWIIGVYLNRGDWSASGVDHSGRQSIASTQITYRKNDWGVALTESYASTSYNTSLSSDNFDVDTPTDVALSSYYIKKFGRVTLRGGLDISFATGTNQYRASELQSQIIDNINEDLMLINNYGSGTNIRPHMLAVYSAGRATWGMGANYLFSGAYDPVSDDGGGDEYDQGDKFTLFISNLYKLTDTSFALTTFSYSNWETDTFGGRELFSNGDKYQIAGRWSSEWIRFLRGTLGVRYSWQDKNKTLDASNSFVQEKSNTNGNEIELFIDGVYSLSKAFSPTFIVGYKQAQSNGYTVGEPLYDAGRSMIYLEPGIIWYPVKDIYLTGKFRYTRIEDGKDAFSREDATYDVFNLDIGVVMAF